MDKPRHPLVIRPWKTQPTKRNQWSGSLLGTAQGRAQRDWKAQEKNPFESKNRKKALK